MDEDQSATATVLFTDLVGSTELLSRLGDAAFDGLRRAHFGALREAITKARGTEVKTTGDGLLATFPSAAGAVGCAVGMQQAVEVHSRTVGIALAIRVGLALGDVRFEDGDVFGAPVVEAARLVAVARAGQILAATVVRAVAGGRCAASFTDVGSLELKGLPAPVAACEVAWEPLPAAAVPLPALLIGMGRIFVGRDGQLAQLQRLWQEARAGELRVALVGGEPGVGKTRLAAELAARVHGEGATVLAGRCDEDLGVPYQPFVEALRHALDHTAPEALVRRLGRYGGELARLIPELSERAPDLPPTLRSDPETERYRLFDAVASWLGATSQDQPVLLVLDDVHWAAKPTLLLLRHVLRSTEPTRLLVVATYRDSELGRSHPLNELLADLWRQTEAARISVSGLVASDVADFLEEAAGHDLGPDRDDLARVIHRETAGNAFFVREVVRHLIETGGLRQEDGRWMTGRPVEELGIPAGVREVVGQRVARLSEIATRVLAVAAVVGHEFEPAVLQTAGSLDEEATLTALDEAVASRLVVEIPGPAPRYGFSHALVRATLYDELSAARRVALHRRVGEAIEQVHAARVDDYLPTLAHHFALASGPWTETLKAVEYATRSGDRALIQLAHDEATEYYTQALDLIGAAEGAGEGQRLALLIALGEAQRRGGNPAYRQTLLDAAQLAQIRKDPHALVRAALANCRGGIFSSSAVVDADRVGVLEAALAETGESHATTRARLLANLGLELVFALDRDPAALSDEALAVARRLGDPATLAHVLRNRWTTIASSDTHAEQWNNTAELVALADTLDDPALRCEAFYFRARSALAMGDMAELNRCLDLAERLAIELGQPTLRWLTIFPRIGQLMLSGRLQEAERLSLEALQVGRPAASPMPRTSSSPSSSRSDSNRAVSLRWKPPSLTS